MTRKAPSRRLVQARVLASAKAIADGLPKARKNMPTERLVEAISLSGFERYTWESDTDYLLRYGRSGQKITEPICEPLKQKEWCWNHPRFAELEDMPRPLPGGRIGNGFLMGKEGRE